MNHNPDTIVPEPVECPRCRRRKELGKEDVLFACWRCGGTEDVSGEQTQPERFAEMTTDWLLSLRQKIRFTTPRFPGDDSDCNGRNGWEGYRIDHVALRAELAKRPHRIRAKDRRKKKTT